MSGALTFTIHLRPWTVNAQRRMHYHETAHRVNMWRAAAKEACEGKEALTTPVHVNVVPFLQHHYQQDVGACYPAVKAAIDGMVDAGIIPDDTPEHLEAITMVTPFLGHETNSVVFLVQECVLSAGTVTAREHGS